MAVHQSNDVESGATEKLFESLEQYPWHSDEEFQSGLQAILGPDPDPSQAEALMLRAQCFYFARKFGTSVDFAAYQEWHSQRVSQSETRDEVQAAVPPKQNDDTPPTASSGQQEQKPPYPVSFSQVVELISTGQPIPGIKDIPDTILEGQASQSSATVRKKPWEP